MVFFSWYSIGWLYMLLELYNIGLDLNRTTTEYYRTEVISGTKMIRKRRKIEW